MKQKFEEVGCRDNGNFRLFLHIIYSHRTGGDSSACFPWPFVAKKIDPDTLLAYYHTTHYEGWPDHWAYFPSNMLWFVRKADSNPRWFLAKGTHSTEFDRLNATDIPKEFLNAFNGSD